MQGILTLPGNVETGSGKYLCKFQIWRYRRGEADAGGIGTTVVRGVSETFRIFLMQIPGYRNDG